MNDPSKDRERETFYLARYDSSKLKLWVAKKQYFYRRNAWFSFVSCFHSLCQRDLQDVNLNKISGPSSGHFANYRKTLNYLVKTANFKSMPARLILLPSTVSSRESEILKEYTAPSRHCMSGTQKNYYHEVVMNVDSD